MPSEGQHTLLRWVKSGPDYSESIPARMAAFIVWWRIWAFGGVLVASLFPGLYVYTHVGHGEGVFAAWLTVWLVSIPAIKISPKYNVTKNY